MLSPRSGAAVSLFKHLAFVVAQRSVSCHRLVVQQQQSLLKAEIWPRFIIDAFLSPFSLADATGYHYLVKVYVGSHEGGAVGVLSGSQVCNIFCVLFVVVQQPRRQALTRTRPPLLSPLPFLSFATTTLTELAVLCCCAQWGGHEPWLHH